MSTTHSFWRRTLFPNVKDYEWPNNGFELSGRGIPDCFLFFCTRISYNQASKSCSIPGPFQRIRKGTFTPFLG